MTDKPLPQAGLPAEIDPEASEMDAKFPQVTRDNLGRFVKGLSGNPKGKPKGIKNRLTLLRMALEESALRGTADKLPEMMTKAVEMATDGDKDLLKLFMKEVLNASKSQRREEDTEEKGKTTIKVTINNFTGPKSPQKPPLEGVFTSQEG